MYLTGRGLYGASLPGTGIYDCLILLRRWWVENSYGGLYLLSGILLRHALSQALHFSQQIVSKGQLSQNKDWRFAGRCKDLALLPFA